MDSPKSHSCAYIYIKNGGGENESLEHRYLQTIEVSLNDKVVDLMKFHMTQSNTVIPHAILQWQVTVSKHFLCQ